MIDFYCDPQLLQNVKQEFAKKTEGVTYKPEGPRPVPKG
jgi:hypothetical protein